MNIKKITAAVLSAALAFSASVPVMGSSPDVAFTAIAEETADYTEVTEGYLTYRVYNEHAELVVCSKEANGEIVIPSSISNKPVTAITGMVFQNRNQIKEITIPSSVRSIPRGSYTFLRCSSLKNINVLTGNKTYYSENGVLFMTDCGERSLVIYPSGRTDKQYSIPEGIKKIENSAFIYNETLEKVFLPKTLASIGQYAFAYSHITSIDIPFGVNSIDSFAFFNCPKLTEITFWGTYCNIYASNDTISNTGKSENCTFTGTIKGYPDSPAQKYAEKFGRNFVALEGPITPPSSEEPHVGDVVWVTDDTVTYWAHDRSQKEVVSAKMTYDVFIIDRYDENNWRVHVPFMNEPEKVYLLDVSYHYVVESHDGYIVGDLCHDNVIDSFDLCLLRKAVTDDFSDLDDYSDISRLIERSWFRALADVNSDSVLSIADLVCMSNQVLGNQGIFE